MWSVLLDESLLEICGVCYLKSQCWKFVECVNSKSLLLEICGECYLWGHCNDDSVEDLQICGVCYFLSHCNAESAMAP